MHLRATEFISVVIGPRIATWQITEGVDMPLLNLQHLSRHLESSELAYMKREHLEAFLQ